VIVEGGEWLPGRFAGGPEPLRPDAEKIITIGTVVKNPAVLRPGGRADKTAALFQLRPGRSRGRLIAYIGEIKSCRSVRTGDREGQETI
jgi:hypothetical protein